jgi:hypothetical protein
MKRPEPDIRTYRLPEIGEIIINRQRFSLTLSEHFQSTYSFDAEGRLLSCFLAGKNYRRGLDSSVMVRYWNAEGQKVREKLAPPDIQNLIETVVQRVRYIGAVAWPELDGPTRAWLERVFAWDSARLASERKRFAAVYPVGVGILPPDQYLSVVLQATRGCSWNRCTFCTLYRGQRFAVASPDDFASHIQQVKGLLGEAIGLRKSLFLGDANALIIPQERLLALLDLAHDHFPIDAPRPGFDYVLNGIYAFLDIFGAEHKTLADYRALQQRGVRRIYIGLETGDDEVFQLLNKPGSPQEAFEVVRTIKQAGLQVGVIVLAGAGGAELAAQHINNSVRVLAAMPLNASDIIYISPLVVSEEETYSQRLRDKGLRPLSQEETHEQVTTIKHTLKTGVATGGANEHGEEQAETVNWWEHDRPRVTLYHIHEFMY